MEKLDFAELMGEMLPQAMGECFVSFSFSQFAAHNHIEANVPLEIKHEVTSLLQGFFQREIQ
jgi:hypothetical protein